MRVVAIIPARGGSKRIPQKNTSDICGVPMFLWTVFAARDAGCDVVVSTDCKDIAALAKRAQAIVVMRPPEFATDEAQLEPVVEHALRHLPMELYEGYESIALLQPTSPLRDAQPIREALAFLADKYDSVVGGLPDPSSYFTWREDEYGDAFPLYASRPRTQELSGLLRENGAMYLTTRGAWECTGRRVSGRIKFYRMPKWASVDVDDLDDLDQARWRMMRQLMRRQSVFARAAGWLDKRQP